MYAGNKSTGCLNYVSTRTLFSSSMPAPCGTGAVNSYPATAPLADHGSFSCSWLRDCFTCCGAVVYIHQGPDQSTSSSFPIRSSPAGVINKVPETAGPHWGSARPAARLLDCREERRRHCYMYMYSTISELYDCCFRTIPMSFDELQNSSGTRLRLPLWPERRYSLLCPLQFAIEVC